MCFPSFLSPPAFYSGMSLKTGSPSAPRFDLTSPPVLEGTDITLVWLPSNDTGGADSLYYDVYTAQLDSSDPVFCKQNDDEIDSGNVNVTKNHVGM